MMMLYEESYFDVNTYMVDDDCNEDDELVTIAEEEEDQLQDHFNRVNDEIDPDYTTHTG